jgi:hypothetical protein
MKSNIKYILLRDGCMPEYETVCEFDSVVCHDTRSTLTEKLARNNMRIIAIQQGLLDLTSDDTAYARIKQDRRISVIYKEEISFLENFGK